MSITIAIHGLQNMSCDDQVVRQMVLGLIPKMEASRNNDTIEHTKIVMTNLENMGNHPLIAALKFLFAN